MRHGLFALFLPVLLLYGPAASGQAQARWVDLEPGSLGEEPALHVVESGSERTVIEIEMTGFWSRERSWAGRVLQELQIPGHTQTMEIGKPRIPALDFLVAVPWGSEVKATYQCDRTKIFQEYRIFPFQKPQSDKTEEPRDFAMDEESYRARGGWPEAKIVLGEPAVFAAADFSPDGAYLLVERLTGPWSHAVPWWRFGREIEVWDAEGHRVATVASLPVADEIGRASCRERV